MTDREFIHPSPPVISLLLMVVVTMLSIFHISFSAVLLMVGLSFSINMTFLALFIVLSVFIFSSIKISKGHSSFIIIIKVLALLSLMLSIYLILGNYGLGLAKINIFIVVMMFVLMSLRQYREGIYYRKKHIELMNDIKH